MTSKYRVKIDEYIKRPKIDKLKVKRGVRRTGKRGHAVSIDGGQVSTDYKLVKDLLTQPSSDNSNANVVKQTFGDVDTFLCAIEVIYRLVLADQGNAVATLVLALVEQAYAKGLDDAGKLS